MFAGIHRCCRNQLQPVDGFLHLVFGQILCDIPYGDKRADIILKQNLIKGR